MAPALLAVGGSKLAVGVQPSSWLGITGGIVLDLAEVIGLVYVCRLATDPGPLYDRDVPVPMVIALVTLTASGLLAVGLHLLLAGYPRWAGLTGWCPAPGRWSGWL